MRIITGTITNGVTLASGDSPVLIGGVVTNDGTGSTVAVYAGADVNADIRNAGTVGDAGTFIGITLTAAGTITNGAPAATNAEIEGGSYGLRLGSTSTVTNYGSIIGGFAGARLAADGKITNGSAADTAALISGGDGEGLSFGEFGGTGVGTVVNFGTVSSTHFVGVDLGTDGGGRVINGSAADTTALITGYGDGIRMIFGAGTVSNFGTITATVAHGIGILGAYPDPLRVTNGSSTSTKALISGTYGINAAAGSAITNFGTIAGSGTGGEALDLRGGTIVNGAATSTAALLQGNFVAVYLSGTGRVTNFGEIEGGGVSILLTAGGTIVNGSSSDQTALIGNGIDGIDVSGTAAATVTNFGTIEGVDSSILFGAGNDKLIVEAGAKFVGSVDGGDGTDTVTFAGGGTLAVSNFAGFEDFVLSAAGADTLTLTNANFADVTNSTITVKAGSPGDTVNASGVTGANHAVFVGGAGADTIIAGGFTTMTGGAGADIFELTTPGTLATPDKNIIADFTHSTDKIAFSDAGFHLGLSGASSTPTALPASLFTSNTTGEATSAAQRFIYNTSNGNLFYDADGSGTGHSRQLVATLTGHPTLTVADLFFTT